MTDLQLYQQLLGLTPPWTVQAVEVDPDRCEVRVRVESEPETVFGCPECAARCPGYDLREERRWRHLDSCGFETWLLAQVPRVRCPEHGVKSVEVPWAGPFSRFTAAFSCFAIAVLRATQQQSQAAQLLGMTVDEVAYLQTQVVEAGLARRRTAAETDQEPPLEVLALDEKQYGRGQRYVTVLSDPSGQRVWEVAPDRTQETVVKLLETCLTASQREQVRTLTMDLWQGFRGACAQVLPRAKVVYDRFHIAQELGHALDLTRRAEHKRLREGAKPARARRYGLSPLSGTRFWWLQAAETLTADKRKTLESLAEQGLETGRVWRSKEAFREFFTQPDPATGKAFFQRWAAAGRQIGNRWLTAVVDQFERHLPLLLNALATGLTNSFAEHENGIIQTLRERARGFRSAQACRTTILFHLGKLDLCPHGFP